MSMAVAAGYRVVFAQCWYLDHVRGERPDWEDYYNCDPKRLYSYSSSTGREKTDIARCNAPHNNQIFLFKTKIQVTRVSLWRVIFATWLCGALEVYSDNFYPGDYLPLWTYTLQSLRHDAWWWWWYICVQLRHHLLLQMALVRLSAARRACGRNGWMTTPSFSVSGRGLTVFDRNGHLLEKRRTLALQSLIWAQCFLRLFLDLL